MLKMESNRGECERCIEKALIYLMHGDHKLALRFLFKAEKLYPTERAKGKAFK